MKGDAAPTPPSGSDDIHEAIRIAQGARTRPRVAVVIVVVLVLTVATSGWVLGWFAPTAPIVKPQTCAGHVAILGDGSSAASPVMRTWAAFYNTSVCAHVSYVSSTTGVSALASKSVDFTVLDGALSPEDSSQLGAASVSMPVTLQATTVVYHIPGVSSGLELSGQQLARIYLGAITNWNNSSIRALNPGVPLPSSLPITVFYCATGCSTTLAFTQYLSNANQTWNSTVGTTAAPSWPTGVSEPTSAAVTAAVNQTAGGIGYGELPFALAANLTWAALQNPAGTFVTPTAVNTTAAAVASNPAVIPETGTPSNESLVDQPGNDTYPIATMCYVVVYKDIGVAYGGALTQNTAQWLASYVLWVTTAAQGRGVPLGYAPLSPALVTWDSEVVELVVYYGLPVLSGGDADGGL